MFAILGKVEFDLITYFDGLETRFGADYAEHPLIARKPRLQFVGDKLDEVRIDLVLHASYCNPEAELVRLRQALASHDALSLVLGNGDYKGRFVITGLTATGRHTDSAGTLLAVEASLELLEFTGDPALPTAPAVQAAGSTPRVPSTGALVAALPANVPATSVSGLAQAVAATKSAFSTASKALSVVAIVRNLANADPLGAIARLPNLTRSLAAVLPGLGLAADRMAQFNGLIRVAVDAGNMAQRIALVRAEVETVNSHLSAASPGNLIDRLSIAEGPVALASVEIQKAALPLARLAAVAATRSV